MNNRPLGSIGCDGAVADVEGDDFANGDADDWGSLRRHKHQCGLLWARYSSESWQPAHWTRAKRVKLLAMLWKRLPRTQQGATLPLLRRCRFRVNCCIASSSARDYGANDSAAADNTAADRPF